MNRKDTVSLMIGAGLAFLAWYFVKGNAPKLQWRINPASGNLEPAPYNVWAAENIQYGTKITPEPVTYVTEFDRAGMPPAPYASWEAYDRARIISGRTGGASGSW